jgi:hypothetical protein
VGSCRVGIISEDGGAPGSVLHVTSDRKGQVSKTQRSQRCRGTFHLCSLGTLYMGAVCFGRNCEGVVCLKSELLRTLGGCWCEVLGGGLAGPSMRASTL